MTVFKMKTATRLESLLLPALLCSILPLSATATEASNTSQQVERCNLTCPQFNISLESNKCKGNDTSIPDILSDLRATASECTITTVTSSLMNSSCAPASCPEEYSSIGNVTTSNQSMNCTPDTVTAYRTKSQPPVYSIIVSTVTTSLPCSKLNEITPIESCSLPSTTETSTVYTTVMVTPSRTEGSTTEYNNQASSSNGTSIALGIVVGLLTLLLTAVTIVSVAIIYTIQSKRVTKANRATIPNTTNATTTSHNITLRRFSNPMYEGDTMLPIRRPSPSSGENVLAPHTQEAGGHMYEAIKPPTGMSNRRSLDSSRRESVQKHTQDSVKVISREVCVERQGSRTLEECDIENHYHLLDAEPEEGRSPGGENRDKENHYHLVWQEGERSKDGESRDRESDYHLVGHEDGMREEGEDKDQESDYHLLGQEDEGSYEKSQVDEDRDKENHYHLVEQENEKSQHGDRESDYNLLGQEDEGSQDGDTESDYHLLSDVNVEAKTTAAAGRAEAIYHVIETPGNDDNDYEDPDDGNLFLSSVPGPYSRPSVHYHGAPRIKTDSKLTRSSHT